MESKNKVETEKILNENIISASDRSRNRRRRRNRPKKSNLLKYSPNEMIKIWTDSEAEIKLDLNLPETLSVILRPPEELHSDHKLSDEMKAVKSRKRRPIFGRKRDFYTHQGVQLRLWNFPTNSSNVLSNFVLTNTNNKLLILFQS